MTNIERRNESNLLRSETKQGFDLIKGRGVICCRISRMQHNWKLWWCWEMKKKQLGGRKVLGTISDRVILNGQHFISNLLFTEENDNIWSTRIVNIWYLYHFNKTEKNRAWEGFEPAYCMLWTISGKKKHVFIFYLNLSQIEALLWTLKVALNGDYFETNFVYSDLVMICSYLYNIENLITRSDPRFNRIYTNY